MYAAPSEAGALCVSARSKNKGYGYGNEFGETNHN